MRRTKITFLTAFVFLLSLFSMETHAQVAEALMGKKVSYWLHQLDNVLEQDRYSPDISAYYKYSNSSPYWYKNGAAEDLRLSTTDYVFNQIFAMGNIGYNNPKEMITGVNVAFYKDLTDEYATYPGDTFLIYENYQNFIFDEVTGDILIYFDTDIVLPAGTVYWFTVMPLIDKDIYNGTWDWQFMTSTSKKNAKPVKRYDSGTYNPAWNDPVTDYDAKKWIQSDGNLAFSFRTQMADDISIAMVSTTVEKDNFTSEEQIGWRVFNAGSNPQAGPFTVSYTVNGGTPVTEEITPSIPVQPFSYVDGYFATTIDLSADGEYQVKLDVSMTATDENTVNNSKTVTMFNPFPVYHDRYRENLTFEGCSGNYYNPGMGQTRINVPGTKVSNTILPSGSGNMSVLNFVGSHFPSTNPDGSPKPGTSVIDIKVYDGLDETAPLLGSVPSMIGSGDEPVMYTATNSYGALTVVYIEEVQYANYLWDAEVSCIVGAAEDMMLTWLGPDNANDFTANETVSVNVKNMGSEAQANVMVYYTAGTDTLEYIIETIAVDEEVVVVFDETIDMSAEGDYEITAWVAMSDDANPENNTISMKFTNYGGFYNIVGLEGADINDCSGLLTDDGGLDGDAQSTDGGLAIPAFETRLFASDADHRIEMIFDEYEMGDGTVRIANDTVYDDEISKLFGIDIKGSRVLATNATGGLAIEYKAPSTEGNSGFAARFHCVEILEDDMFVGDMQLSNNIVTVNDYVYVSAKVINIGKNNGTANVYFTVGADTLGTYTTAILAPNATEIVEFAWIPQADGNKELNILIDDANGDEYYHAVTSEVNVAPFSLMYETFDVASELPQGWYTVGDTYTWAQLNNVYHSFDATGSVACGSQPDTLVTALVNIKAGDVLTFYAKAEKRAGPWSTVADPTPGLVLAWYNKATDTWTNFDWTAEGTYAKEYQMFSVDVSAAEGINQIAFINSIAYKSIYIDIVSGLEYVVEGTDVALNSFNLPSLSKTEIETNFSVVVANNGGLVQPDEYTVDLYEVGNETALASLTSGPITIGKTTELRLSHMFAQTGEYDLYTVINYVSDTARSNDTSIVRSIVVNEVNNSGFGLDVYDSKQAFPLNTNKEFSIANMIYTEDMIGAIGKINQMTLMQESGNADTVNIKVWVGMTDSTTLANGFIKADELTKVYDNEEFILTDDDMTEVVIPFDTEIDYTGGNLAVLVYQNGDASGDHKFMQTYNKNRENAYLLYSVGTDTIDAAGITIDSIKPENYSVDDYFMISAKFYINQSALITNVVTDEMGTAIAGYDVTMVEEFGKTYSGTTNDEGIVQFENVAFGSYSISYMKEGYEAYVMEKEISADDSLKMTFEMIKKPVGVATVVDNAAKTAVVSWGATKLFAHYNVYFNDMTMPYMDSVAVDSMVFTDLADGEYVVGVQAVYEGGELSEIVTDTFNVVYAPMDINAMLFANESAYASWKFEGTSDDFAGFQVSLNGTAVDTVNETSVIVNDLVDGVNEISVVSIYTKGGLSAEAIANVTVINGVTNLTATVDSVNASISWTGNAADSYVIYLNSDTVFATTPDTVTSFAFTNLAAGTYVAGVAGVYGDATSIIEKVVFNIDDYTVETVYAAIEGLDVAIDETNHTATVTWTANDADSYNVTVNGGDVVNVTSASYEITDLVTSYYIVSVVAVYGDNMSNASTIDFTYEKAVGVNNANAFEFNVYPNPANAFVTIEGVANSTVQVYSLTGALVESMEVLEATTKLDITNLSKGVYLVRVINESGIAVKQLTVE